MRINTVNQSGKQKPGEKHSRVEVKWFCFHALLLRSVPVSLLLCTFVPE